MKYPEEIYKDINGKEMTNTERLWGEGMIRRRAYYLGHEAGYWKGYEAGKADPLEGYSNLTAAIKAGDPIDWERLDGLDVKCVKPEPRGEIHGKLVRNKLRPADKPAGWWDRNMDSLYVLIFIQGWGDQKGWTLWVKGEIPLRRKTADQLEAYTYFYGEAPSGEPDLMYVGGLSESSKAIYYAPEMRKTATPATEWVVLEEYGPFQKPEENKK